MGLVRSPSLRSEEYFECIIKDYVNGKGSAKMNRGCNKRSSSSSSSSSTPRLIAALTMPFHHVWILFFGSPKEPSLKIIMEGYNNCKISFISLSYDFKYYGRFQMALQTESDFVYIVDDDKIPGKKMLEILAHVGSTEKYKNSVLGSIGRILTFRQKDFTFPSYRKLRTKEAGLYLLDHAYDITVDRIVQVDFLSSSWRGVKLWAKTLVQKSFVYELNAEKKSIECVETVTLSGCYHQVLSPTATRYLLDERRAGLVELLTYHQGYLTRGGKICLGCEDDTAARVQPPLIDATRAFIELPPCKLPEP
ncbi:hypothetical protein KSP40_PGU000257 [Platanthera guangdongensis]|uniref:Uncharacterized protein n=1 Tax=Platanthera guangdongensis TaxID=2320717 RepID=A0ABR2MT66_9ASPA